MKDQTGDTAVRTVAERTRSPSPHTFGRAPPPSCEPLPTPEPVPSVVCDLAEPASPSAPSAGFDDVLESWDASICLSLKLQLAEISGTSARRPQAFID